MVPATKTKPLTLDEIIQLIPGYDPVATAGNCWFDADAAIDAIAFIEELLTHVKGELALQPLLLEDWQKAIVANIFGWKRPDGTRRYREVLIYVARKNGKTVLLAAILLVVLFTDGELGAELYSAAADRDQATLVFEQAKGMVVQSPELMRRAKIFTKAITYEAEGSSYKAISAEANTKHGYNSHFVGVDELHAQKNRELIDVLLTSVGSRRQPLVVHITTADFDRESICNEKHKYAGDVRDGIIDDIYFLPVIYEATKDDDWTDPAVWATSNPNLDVSVKREYLERECKRAQESPAFENTFKRLHLNIMTEQDVRWLSLAKWDACTGSVAVEDLAGRECFAGLDLANTTDVAAFAMVFPDVDGQTVVLMRFWVPTANAREREKRDKVPYVTWAKQGLVTMTPGNVIDYDIIRRDINELHKTYNIREIAIDRWNATQITTQLQGDGFDVIEFGQGFASMSAPTKELEKLVIGEQLAHGGNPVLRWMASNVSVQMDAAGNMKPAKDKSSEKIDGIVALVMGIGRAMVRTEVRGSVYERRGMLVL